MMVFQFRNYCLLLQKIISMWARCKAWY